jgi:NAD(P)-dependent dehydrogenase (short-subunit alcohol dehydrogenase family)
MVHARNNRAGCEEVSKELATIGAATRSLLLDLAHEGAGTELVQETVRAFGRLDILVHAAGFPVRSVIGEASPADFSHAFGVVTRAFFELTTAALPFIVQANVGRVVAISSHNAHVFRTGYPVYPVSGSAKAAIETMIRSLAVQIAPSGATANVVVPGLIRKAHGEQFLTPEEWSLFPRLIPMGRIGEPDEVASVIEFLCSNDASYVTGQVIHVSGGLS